jgi:hypothetical protein
MKHRFPVSALLVIALTLLSSVWAMAQQQLTITYPEAGSSFESGSEVLVRWESTDYDDLINRLALIEIDISSDDGVTWQTAVPGVSPQQNEIPVNLDVFLVTGENYRFRIREVGAVRGPEQLEDVSDNFEVYEGCIDTRFLQQPMSQTVCLGQPLALNVRTTAKYVTYVWSVNDVVVAETEEPSYLIEAVGEEHLGQWTVGVRKKCELLTTSAPAFIRAAAPAVITTQPAAATTACELERVVLDVAADGSGVRYEWFFNDERIPGATGTRLVLDPVSTANAGVYHVVATNLCGDQVTSDPATVTVETFARINRQPDDAAVCEGASVQLVTGAAGADHTVQWYRNGEPIEGATGNDLFIAAVNAETAGRYSARITTLGTQCVREQWTREATVSTYGGPYFTKNLEPKEICAGSTADLIVNTGGVVNEYIWRRNGVVIATTQTNVLHIANASLSDAGTYTVELRGACGLTATSRTAALSVVERPIITEHPRSIRVRKDRPFLLRVVANTNASYQWLKNSVEIPGATASTYNVNAAATTDAGSYAVKVTNSCGTVLSNVGTVQVIDPSQQYGELAMPAGPIELGTLYRGVKHFEALEGMLTNIGELPLSISGISGTNGATILTPSAYPVVLQPDAGTDLVFSVVPAQLGTQSYEIAVLNDGIEPDARFTATADVASVFNEIANLDFGRVSVGTERDSCITITNTTTFFVKVTSVAATASSALSVNANVPVTVNPGESFDVCVTFAPTAQAASTIDIVISGEDGILADLQAKGIGDNPSSVDEGTSGASIVAYPNPTSGAVSLRSSLPIERLIVRDALGSVVADLRGDAAQWDGRLANGIDAPSGPYFLSVTTAAGTQVLPIIRN